jgi:hypothetical protein
MDLIQLDKFKYPERTDTYVPILHKDFAELVLESGNKQGFSIRNTNYDVAREGNIMRGIFAFIGDDSAMDMQVGILNSYDKSKKVTIGLGSQVFICQNGMVSADYTMKRKHTGSVEEDIKYMIEEGMKRLYDEYRRNIEVRERLSKVEVTKSRYAELIGRMFIEEGIITSTQLNIVKKEFEGSKLFPEPTAWSMYNHVNHALKVGHPADYITQHVELHKFMIENLS